MIQKMTEFLFKKDKENFKTLIEVVGDQYNINERIIEKDYWVTYCLSKLLNFYKKDMIIFRGGTSLTKCYKDLNRFSEDIDFSVNKLQFTGNDIYKTVVSASTLELDPVPDQITGNPVTSHKQFVPKIDLLNSINIAALHGLRRD